MDHPLSNEIRQAVELYRGCYLFTVGARYVSELNRGELSNKLKNEFKNKGELLSDRARVSVIEKGECWEVRDGHQEYSICKLGVDKLNVSLKPKVKENTASAAYFEKLFKYVCTTLGMPDSVELRVPTILIYFGPSGDPLPKIISDHLIDLLRKHCPSHAQQMSRVAEFAIAYGCGKFPKASGISGNWNSDWELAVRALARALNPWVRESLLWSNNGAEPFSEDVRRDADILALSPCA